MQPKLVAAGLRAVKLPDSAEDVSKVEAMVGWLLFCAVAVELGACPGGLNASPASLGGVGSVCWGRGAVADVVVAVEPGQKALACPCGCSSEGDLSLYSELGLRFSDLYRERSRLGN